jgi:hypothetical protein
MINGFIDVFREEFEKINFPIEVARIRMANDPLKAVSRGCMVAAIEETRALNETDVTVAPATLERTQAQVSKVDDGTKRRLGPIHMPDRLPGGPQRVAPVKVASPMPSASPSIVPAAKVVKVDAPSMPPAIVRGRDEGAKVLKVAPPAQPAAAPKKDTSVRTVPRPFSSNQSTPPPPPPPKKKEAELELVEVEEITELTPDPKQDDAGDDIPLIS